MQRGQACLRREDIHVTDGWHTDHADKPKRLYCHYRFLAKALSSFTSIKWVMFLSEDTIG